MTSSHYKVIALISGGKDSFLSILQCQEQGHEIVALANLYPPAGASQDEDLNSHMYQTAGHALIPFYEQALGIPLYRAEIKGKATQLGREYDTSYLSSLIEASGSSDETEDLTLLLQNIFAKHPEVNAVCSGAILSTYQRTRIENVCLRLQLKPLAYLWQMSLLSDMPEHASILEKSTALLDHFATVGLDARIVKVASGGLDESYLWQSLLDLKTRNRIKSTMKRFGGSVVGEGGEFETLVVSGPRSLFKKRIIVGEEGMKIKTGQGGEAWVDLDPSSISIAEHESSEQVEHHGVDGIEIKAQGVAPDLPDSLTRSTTTVNVQNNQTLGHSSVKVVQRRLSLSTHMQGNLVWYNNITTIESPRSCQEQTKSVIRKLEQLLRHDNMTSRNLVFTTIILRSMNDFEAVNKIYGKLFSAPLPPARVTVAVGAVMPADILVSISCVAYRDSILQKKGLHVQSVSHWAPANIGPYSQAISIPVDNSDGPRMAFIAGQIPLVPGTMQAAAYEHETAQEEFRRQTALALRHATRIGIEMDVCWWSHAVAFVCSDGNLDAANRAGIAYAEWKILHDRLDDEEDDDDTSGLDAWDLKYGGQGSLASDTDNLRRYLPPPEALRPGSDPVPGFLAVQVEQLPRGQTIEWQVLGYGAGEIESKVTGHTCQLFGSNANDCLTSTSISPTSAKDAEKIGEDLDAAAASLQNAARTLYTTPAVQPATASRSHNTVVIPCTRVWAVCKQEQELQEVSEAVVMQQFKSR